MYHCTVAIPTIVGASLRGRYSDHSGCIIAWSLFRPSWVYHCAVAIPTIVGASLRGRYSDHRGCIIARSGTGLCETVFVCHTFMLHL